MTIDADQFVAALADPNEYWAIEYNKDGEKRKTVVYASTLMTALAMFNANEETSGFDTPIRMKYGYGVNGQSYIWELDGRYGVPRRV
jgi:hypothetical protein